MAGFGSMVRVVYCKWLRDLDLEFVYALRIWTMGSVGRFSRPNYMIIPQIERVWTFEI